MEPKIGAVLHYLERGRKHALITNLGICCGRCLEKRARISPLKG